MGWERVEQKVKRMWKFHGPNEPSGRLIDEAFAMLQKNMVAHIAWERCTSRQQVCANKDFLRDPGLVLTESGVFQHVQADGPTADLSGDTRWENAMRCRAAAMDIAGLLELEAHNLWTEMLRGKINKDPPRGYQRVSWLQVLEADIALFDYVDEKMGSDGPRRQPGETITRFQKYWVEGILDPEVRQSLAPLREANVRENVGTPGAAASLLGSAPSPPSHHPSAQASSDSRLAALERRLAAAENEKKGLKRKLDAKAAGKGKGGKAGKGKGWGKWDAPQPPPRQNDRNSLPPRHVQRQQSDHGKRFCFNFNRNRGCALAGPGGECNNGVHFCVICAPDATHGAGSGQCPLQHTY